MSTTHLIVALVWATLVTLAGLVWWRTRDDPARDRLHDGSLGVLVLLTLPVALAGGALYLYARAREDSEPEVIASTPSEPLPDPRGLGDEPTAPYPPQPRFTAEQVTLDAYRDPPPTPPPMSRDAIDDALRRIERSGSGD